MFPRRREGCGGKKCAAFSAGRPLPLGQLFRGTPRALVWNSVGAQFPRSKSGNRPFRLPAGFRGARGTRALRQAARGRADSAMGSVVRRLGPTQASPPRPRLRSRSARRGRRGGAGPAAYAPRGGGGGSWEARGRAGKWTQREVPVGPGSRRPLSLAGCGPARWWGPNAKASGNREKWLPLVAARTRTGVLSALERAAVRTRRTRAPLRAWGRAFNPGGMVACGDGTGSPRVAVGFHWIDYLGDCIY